MYSELDLASECELKSSDIPSEQERAKWNKCNIAQSVCVMLYTGDHLAKDFAVFNKFVVCTYKSCLQIVMMLPKNGLGNL
jgi:hypothetical protein